MDFMDLKQFIDLYIQDDLNSFLVVAEELQVKGLTQSDSASKKSEDLPRGERKELNPTTRTKDKETRSQRHPQTAPPDEEIQEIVPIKTELSSKSDYYEDTQHQVTQYEEEGYDNYQDYEADQDYEVAPSATGQQLDNTKGSYEIPLLATEEVDTF